MICKCGSLVSGDYCKVCSTYLKEPKARTKTIKKRSEKGEKEDLIYKALRIKFLKDNPRCAVFPEKKAIQVHHRKGRIGKYYLDVRYFLPVSFEGHRKIEENPEWAYEMGFSLSRLSKEETE